MLTQSQYEEIRSELLDSKKPLFLFHDDPDGLTSFLLLYHLVKRGTGMMVKAVPRVDDRFVRKAKEESYDKVFIMDIAMLEQSFVDEVKKPVIWIDHHPPMQVEGARYFNPRLANPSDNYPASYLCFKVAQENEDDLWIAMVGVVGDWMIPEFAPAFAKRYPDLWGNAITKPDDALFETRLGTLIKVFAFVQKGDLADAVKCIRILTRITSPYEILDQKTPAGKYLFNKYQKINAQYEKVHEGAKAAVGTDRFVIHTYLGEQSFSSEVANELLHFHPDKVIVIGREKDGEVRMSLRGSGKNLILPRLKEALVGITGYGGGHEYACGAAVKVADFEKFIDKFKSLF